MNEKSIHQRFKEVSSLYREWTKLKITVSSSKKYVLQENEEGRLPKLDTTLIDNMAKRVLHLESKLNKLLCDE